MEEIEREIQDYIEGHNICTLAVTDGKNPSAHTVYYISHNLHIYFESNPDSQKIHVLHSNPNISLTIDEDYKDWRKIKGIPMFGQAKIIAEKHAPPLREAYAAKFPSINELGGIPQNHVFVEVIPEKIYSLDFTKKFGNKSVYYSKGTSSQIDW